VEVQAQFGRRVTLIDDQARATFQRTHGFWGLTKDAVERDREIKTPLATRALVPSLASTQAPSPPVMKSASMSDPQSRPACAR